MHHSLNTWLRGLTAGLALLILLLSLLPLPEPPVGGFDMADKIGHAAAYLLLSFLLVAAQLPAPRARAVPVAIAGSVLMGGLIELVQPLVHRNRELADLLANVAGSTTGALLALAVSGWLTRALLGRKGRT